MRETNVYTGKRCNGENTATSKIPDARIHDLCTFKFPCKKKNSGKILFIRVYIIIFSSVSGKGSDSAGSRLAQFGELDDDSLWLVADANVQLSTLKNLASM